MTTLVKGNEVINTVVCNLTTKKIIVISNFTYSRFWILRMVLMRKGQQTCSLKGVSLVENMTWKILVVSFRSFISYVTFGSHIMVLRLTKTSPSSAVMGNNFIRVGCMMLMVQLLKTMWINSELNVRLIKPPIFKSGVFCLRTANLTFPPCHRLAGLIGMKAHSTSKFLWSRSQKLVLGKINLTVLLAYSTLKWRTCFLLNRTVHSSKFPSARVTSTLIISQPLTT